MNLKTLRLTLKSDRPVEEAAAKLRGFFATRFNEHALLHQHINVDKPSTNILVSRAEVLNTRKLYL